MEKFTIESDLTISGTKLSMDSKERTKKEKVIGISLYASSPVKGDEYDSGFVSLSVTTVNEDGTVETQDYRKSEYMSKKIPMGQTIKDFIDKNGNDKIVRFIGHDVDTSKEEIVDKIIQHATDNDISCPDKETLFNRTVDSLKDKAEDMGITIE